MIFFEAESGLFCAKPDRGKSHTTRKHRHALLPGSRERNFERVFIGDGQRAQNYEKHAAGGNFIPGERVLIHTKFLSECANETTKCIIFFASFVQFLWGRQRVIETL